MGTEIFLTTESWFKLDKTALQTQRWVLLSRWVQFYPVSFSVDCCDECISWFVHILTYTISRELKICSI